MRCLLLTSLIAFTLSFQVFAFSDNTDNKTDSTSELGYSSESLLLSLNKSGEGELKVLFWKVYKAEFYITGEEYSETQYPKALKLTYHRDIEKKEFIDVTKDQWAQLNSHYQERLVSETQEEKWLNQLKNIFPTITEKDIILFILTKDKQAKFYLRSFDNEKNHYQQNFQSIGTILDPEFGDYFLSIWLSKNTSEPKIRKQLIGQ